MLEIGVSAENVRIQDRKPTRREHLFAELKRFYPKFDYVVRTHMRENRFGKRSEQKIIDLFNYPLVNGNPPAVEELLRACRGEIPPFAFDAHRPTFAARIQPLLDIGTVGRDFAQLMGDIGCCTSASAILDANADWLNRAVRGVSSTVFAVVCPDYAYGSDGRYTFSELKDGVGLVAKRLLGVLPAIHAFSRLYELDLRIVVAISDFEADSQETLRRVGLSREEFRNRLRRSQVAIASTCDFPVETPFMTEIGDWYGVLDLARGAVADGHFSGTLKLDPQHMSKIEHARTSLYQRWYGENVSAHDILLRQIPEYNAVGMLAANYPNPIMIGCDSPHMAPFFQGLSAKIRPIISLDRRDY